VSRAEARLPESPRLLSSLREAAVDLYFSSTRLVVGNLACGIVLLGVLVALTSAGNLGWLLLIVATPPAAGLMRMCTGVVREGHTVLSDFAAELRRPWRSMAIGAVQLFVLLVLVVDLAVGLGQGGMLGTLLTVSAAYGLAVWWLLACTFWPIYLDPVRASEPLRARLRLAGTLLIAHPIRIGALGLVLGAVLLASVVLFAAILTVSIAFAWLAAARFILPAADRLEGRATVQPAEE
jgi:hypothetical protein